MQIVELDTCSEEYVKGLDALMHELTAEAATTAERVRMVIEDPNMHQYAAFDEDRMVGCATLCVCHTPEKVIGFVEAVVVSSAYRGRHIGRWLMEYVIEQAKQFAPLDLYLTSKPKRVAANNLYHSLGFQKKETNCYRMVID